MYSGFSGDGLSWGPYNEGSYTCCTFYDAIELTNVFGNDQVNSVLVNAKYGYDCKIRLYAAPNWYEYGQDWIEYKVNNASSQIINYTRSDLVVKQFELDSLITPYTVWTQQYSQVSWLTVTPQVPNA